MPKPLTLDAANLLSKWGFEDGDIIDNYLLDLSESWGVRCPSPDAHELLVALVRAYLLPEVREQVEVYEIRTAHNPIRVASVDGTPVDDYYPQEGLLSDVSVEVPAITVWQWAVGQEAPDAA